MELAYEQALAAGERNEVPVGAVISLKGNVVATAGNRTLELKDPTAHAEILAIRQAAHILGSERLTGCDLHVTLEPCPMCASAISQARIARLYFAAQDKKSGAVENGVKLFSNPSCHHVPEVYSGIMEEDCATLLSLFFKARR